MTDWDVAVCGGGSAGVAAAIAAARSGARTLLIERGGLLGGMASAAFVHTICGLYALGAQEEVPANAGFAHEFAGRAALGGPVQMGGLRVRRHDPVLFAAAADHFVQNTQGLEVWCHATLVAAERQTSRITTIRVMSGGAERVVKARAFVDATGDASLARFAGAATRRADAGTLQRPAYIAQLAGLSAELLNDEGRLRLAHAIARGVREGCLPVEALGSAFRVGVSADIAYLTIDLEGNCAPDVTWDPDAPEALARIEAIGRRTALRVAAFIAATVPGVTACRVSAWPSHCGVREASRIVGVHDLTGDDLVAGRQFRDFVARVSWPMELRESACGPRWKAVAVSPPCQIPLRSLRHRDVENLWAAGRCIACAHDAQASLRVIGTCLATGEAAGFAAALEPGGAGGIAWETVATAIRNHIERQSVCA